MKGKFSHSVDWLAVILVIIYIISAPICAIMDKMTTFYTASAAFILLIILCISLLSSNVKSSFHTGNKGLYFKVGFVKYKIPYEDIKDISCRVKEMHGRIASSYRMLLIIETEEKTYRFNDKLNTDTEELLNDRREFDRKVSEHCFSQLCKYVNERGALLNKNI